MYGGVKMNLTQKIAVGIFSLGLAIGAGPDTKVKEIACSNKLFKCSQKDCSSYCYRDFSSKNVIEQTLVTNGGHSCECTYTPKQKSIDMKCENLFLPCSENDCDEQCRDYVLEKGGALEGSGQLNKSATSSKNSYCYCTYKPQ